jgi:hypothetical protein
MKESLCDKSCLLKSIAQLGKDTISLIEPIEKAQVFSTKKRSSRDKAPILGEIPIDFEAGHPETVNQQ